MTPDANIKKLDGNPRQSAKAEIAYWANRWRQRCRHRAPTDGFTASWRKRLSRL